MRESLVGFLEEARKAGRISQWRVRGERRRQLELYYAGTRLEARRTVARESFDVEVLRDQEDGTRGHAKVRLTPGSSRWRELLEALVDMARSRNPAWSFPGRAEHAPDNRHCFDPRLAGASGVVMEELSGRWLEACRSLAARSLVPGHVELFLGHSEESVSTSVGLDVRTESTDFYLEGSVTTAEHERFFLRHGCFLEDVKLEEQVERAAKELLELPAAVLVPQGQYRVLLHANAVAQLFRAATFDLQAESVHHGISRLKTGERFGPEGVTVQANSPIRGLGRSALDEEGVALHPFEVVREGRVVALATTTKYATLTGFPWTGGMRSLHVEGGTRSREELLRSALRDGPVLEVLDFSNLLPDNESKDFSGELRLGYLHRGGERLLVRGGSVAGNAVTVLADAELASERASDFGNPAMSELPYHGPAYALLPVMACSGAQGNGS